MDYKKIRAVGAAVLVALWAVLIVLAWFGPKEEVSLSERRPLDQMPQLSGEDILDGSFMKDFESYSLDQFPLRDSFRSIKSLFHYYVLNQSDNNEIYIADGIAAQMEYPLDESSLTYAADRFRNVYERYLKDRAEGIYFAAIPDKGYYLAEENGYLAMNYSAMFEALRAEMPWAEQINLTDTLNAQSYYRTDTHWRQESLAEAAGRLCAAMDAAAFEDGELDPVAVERPFYGVYHGQAALPMDPDEMYLLEGDILAGCETYLGEIDGSGQGIYRKLYDGVYDREKLAGEDMYETYLSGSQSLVRIENPNAGTDRELIIFRDSFGSAIAPLLVKDYAVVTLVDIRYIQTNMLERFDINWNSDVLFLYSTLVLNNSSTIK